MRIKNWHSIYILPFTLIVLASCSSKSLDICSEDETLNNQNITDSSLTSKTDTEELEVKKSNFLKKVTCYESDVIKRLQDINQGWASILIIIGIVMTAVTALLGEFHVDEKNQNNTENNKKSKIFFQISVALAGVISIAAQSLGREFRVSSKASDYALLEGRITILKDKIPDLKTEEQFLEAKKDFYGIITDASRAEAFLEGVFDLPSDSNTPSNSSGDHQEENQDSDDTPTEDSDTN